MRSEQVKSEILNILIQFDQFCRQNDIQYFLAYGTLLGAVRHHGFIPWDDDIDVIMTAPQYWKLKSIGEKDPYIDEKQRYRLRLPGSKDYCYSYIKVEDTKYRIREKNVADRFSTGLFIDVFRLDYWPKTVAAENYQMIKGKLLLRINEILLRGNITEGKFVILDKLLKPVDLLFRAVGLTSETVCSVLEKQGSKYKKNQYVGMMMTGSGARQRLDADIFDKTIYLPFEGHMFPAPEEYDKNLRMIFGDYMILPDEDQRIGHEYEITTIKE